MDLAIQTDFDGHYKFSDLPAGNDTLSQIRPGKYLDGIDSVGSLGGDQSVDDIISNIQLPDGGSGEGYNFGELEKTSPSGYVYLDKDMDGTRDRLERGIAGVKIVLKGVDDLGNTVKRKTTTDEYGFYEFDGLRAGTYQIIERSRWWLRDHYNDGQDSIGSLGGRKGDDRFSNIVVAAGGQGMNYNFAELMDDDSDD